ncbi:MAG: DNA replication and repair protein RecF [Bacteroidetes bacterium ADurb.Bin408]|nr:MAG: DNA replication and repair protein RecF [Bacteroidetes bacterium ADurb.Bin408]
MYISKLSVLNFKNFKNGEIKPSATINCFIGNNGAGKTNLLDAVYYLSFCKSYFNSIDYQNINHNEPFFMINATFVIDGNPHEIACAVRRNEKKIFKMDDKEYQRLSDHIGIMPLVIISPSDADYINEGSDIRRKFIDSVLAQYDKLYLDHLINYNKALLQRNTLLKNFYEHLYFDKSALEIWDKKIIELGYKIFDKRTAFIKNFLPIFQDYYTNLSGGNEIISITYDSHLQQGHFEKVLADALPNDRKALYTTVGIHKDDLHFTINGFPLKKYGSQGQQKTFLIALKLSQFSVTKEIKNTTPILLLDDIFDKLDNNRVEFLMKIVEGHRFGQVFITDTDMERVKRVLNNAGIQAAYFEVTDNNIYAAK